MKLLELWRISRKVYKEISFQAVFSLRSGGVLPQGKDSIKRVVRNAETNTSISKILTSAFLFISGSSILLSMTMQYRPSQAPIELAMIGAISAFLAMMLSLVVVMGLQVSTALVSSHVAEVLSPLPLSKGDISKIILLSFVMVFDIPLISAIPVFLGIYVFSGGTALGGLAAFVGIIVTEIFAVTLTIGLAKFFYSKVSSGGRSGWRTVMRLVYMLVWILPSFGTYFVMSFSFQIVESFASLTQLFTSTSLLALVYPFSYGFLVSEVTFLQTTDYLRTGVSILSSIVYLALAAFCLRWIMRTMKKISLQEIASGTREEVKDTLVRLQVPWLGIIRKDLRIASRTPSYASLFLLPIMQSVILALPFSSFGADTPTTALGVLSGLSLMALLLPMTTFSIEGLAVAYVKSLPMKERTMISAKTVLSTLIHAASLCLFFAVMSAFRFTLFYVLTLGLIHTFSIAAANMLELMLLTNRFWKKGFSMGNLYSRLSAYILIWIPGLVVVLLPLIAAGVTLFLAENLFMAVLLIVSLSEFALMTCFLASRK